ncbi:MAG: hypothetical protein JSR84_01085 [Proteobacteria bacterium]|nr:hypothetical protein [Pseudomonadota bacterium]
MRFVVPARIAVEATDAGDAIAKARLLVDATSRLRERGYDLAITGPAARGAVARCASCGGRRHDGEPCPSETGVAS